MAESVINANKQRSIALKSRDKALKDFDWVQLENEELKSKYESIQDIITDVELQMIQTRNETAAHIKFVEDEADKRIEEAKVDAADRILKIESSAALAVQEAQTLSEQRIDEAAAEIKLAKDAADRRVEETEIKAKEYMFHVESDSALAVQKAQDLAKKQINDAVLDAENVKQQSKEAIIASQENAR